MANNKTTVFHSRVADSAQELNHLLRAEHFLPLHCPIFELQKGSDLNLIDNDRFNSILLGSSSPLDTILIFTSQYAVEFLQHAIQHKKLLNPLLEMQCVAVGQTTAKKLVQAGFKNVLTPTAPTSEGILQLPVIQTSKQAILFKGEQGRDKLANAFRLANKPLTTYNVYKRQWVDLSETQLQQINRCDVFIFTSGEIAQHLYRLVVDKISPDFVHKLVLVPSERVAKQLTEYGFDQVINIGSASNHNIIAHLRKFKGSVLT
ncbi:uroporphyrinogen-III synthase [Catenovulum sediminis]|uniref:Uroporphyrinogen-III synthase n=1 Tax=Catenovulum sediminis TaxID=1740262 RepID=A0ABV1RHT6_9ALTE|nr:uroporphyrinogen-III synthase [Catenovulum sediminis]